MKRENKEVRKFKIINFIIKINNVKYKLNFEGFFNGKCNLIKYKKFEITSIPCNTKIKIYPENKKLKNSRECPALKTITNTHSETLKGYLKRIKTFIRAYFIVLKEKSFFDKKLKKYDKDLNKYDLNLNKNNINEIINLFNRNIIKLLNYYIQDTYFFYKNLKKYSIIMTYMQNNIYTKVSLNTKYISIKVNKFVFLILLLRNDKLDLVINLVKHRLIDINENDNNNKIFFNYLLKYSSNTKKINKVNKAYRILNEVVNIEINLDCFKDSLYYHLILNNPGMLKLFKNNGLYISKKHLTIMDVIINFELEDLGKVIINMNSSIVNKMNCDGKFPIIVTIEKNRPKIVKLLIGNMENNNSIQTLLSYVIENSNDFYINIIISKIKNNSKYKIILKKIIKNFLITRKFNHLEVLINKYNLISEKMIKKVFKLLRDENISFDIEKKNKNGISFIYFLCKNDFHNIIKILINSNISFDIFNTDSDLLLSPFLIALKNKNFSTLDLLLKSDILKNKNFNTLYLLLKSDILKNKNFINVDDNYHPLFYIYKNKINNNNLIIALIDFGVSIKMQWLENKDFIDYILHNEAYIRVIHERKLKVMNNEYLYEIGNPLIFAIKNDLFELFQILLESKNLQINEINLKEESPLLIAVKNKQLSYVRLILENETFMKCIGSNNDMEYILYDIIMNRNVDLFTLFQELLNKENFEYNIENIFKKIVICEEHRKKHLKFLIKNLHDKNSELYCIIKNFDIKNCKYESPLHNQCYTGNLDILKIIMSNSNSNLNKRAKEDGNTPLIISLKYKKYNITKYLLSDQNINVNKGNRRGYKPLIYMIKNNINEEEIFKKIIEKDEDINNSQYFKNATPLIYAIKKNNVRAIKFLLESKKVDINKRDDNNYCPLDYAIQEKNIEIIELLYDSLNECNNNIRLNEEQNKNRKLENSLYHLLFIGIIYGNKKLIKYLINQDIDINYLSENEENESLTPLICAIKNKQNNIIKFLLKSSRIDVNKPNKEGLTPLIYAIKNKQDDIIKLLLKSSNIDVNKPDKEGLTPLIYAIKNKQDDTIKLLLKSSNIDVNKPNMEGLTHLIYCGISNDDNGNNNNNKKNGTNDENNNNKKNDNNDNNNTLGNEISNSDSDQKHKETSNLNKFEVQLDHFKEKIKNIKLEEESVINDNYNQLMVWIEKNKYRKVKSILSKMNETERRMVLRQENDKGYTPLLKAINRRDKNQIIIKESVINILLEYNVDINQENFYGLTPLLMAIKKEDIKMIELLIKYNVEINYINKQGNSGFLKALECSNPNILIKLLKNNAKIPVKEKMLKKLIIQQLKKGDLLSIRFIIDHENDDINYIKGKLVKFNMLKKFY